MYPRFFWIGEESEVFAAESIRQLATDEGHCGTGIGRWVDSPDRGVLLFDEEGDEIEWGEFSGAETRLTIRNCDEDERRLETMTGNLHDLYAWIDGGRFGLPVMLLTQYS